MSSNVSVSMMKEQRKFERQRKAMMATIEREVADTCGYTGRSQLSDRVMSALAQVARHEFVPDDYLSSAYSNNALPIGYGQTISQPFIVALMTDLLETQSQHRILEIGTGSGYQAAVLAKLVAQVYSIECVVELAQRAATTLQRLGYDNVEVKAGDGCQGWPEYAPFDGIIVTAGGDVPQPLVDQLKPGARLVIPLGPTHQTQYLTVFEKVTDGQLRKTEVLPVRFVPLVEESAT